jgi:hypothetical protein
MRRPIDFDDQLAIDCSEVDDEPVYHMLSAKFPSGKPPVTQRLPETRFGARL